jgi:hypothetical protein
MALPGPRRFRVLTNPAALPETETETPDPAPVRAEETETAQIPVRAETEAAAPWQVPQGQPLTRAEKTGTLIRHWAEAATRSEVWGGGPQGLLQEIRKPEPETMRQHWKHVTSIRFLPEGSTGWVRILPPLLVILHCLITVPVKALGKTSRGIGLILIGAGDRADWAADRLLRLIPAAALTAIVLVILAHFL